VLYQTWISDFTVTDGRKELDLTIDGMLFIIRIERKIRQCVSTIITNPYNRKRFEDIKENTFDEIERLGDAMTCKSLV
jgi:hypothetical protein